MQIFYFTLYSTFILGIISRMHPKGEKNKKPMLLITILILIILVSVAGLRGNIGDTYDYKHLYESIAQGVKVGGSYEPGFIKFLEILIDISTDPQIMVFTTSLITTVLNILVLRRYHSAFELEIYMYIASGFFLVTMNGIRQAMAAAMVFAATKYLIKGEFIKYAIVAIFASTFHTSALIMLPVYYIVRKEAWSKEIIYMIIFASIVLIFIQPIMNILFSSVESGSKLSGYEDAVIGGKEGGANILRPIISSIPVILSYKFKEKLKKLWPESNIFVNLSLINLIFLAFSLYNWLFARFTFYFQTYTFILLPYLIVNMFKRKERDIIYYLFIICYFIFFYYEHVVSMGLIYSSKYLKF